MQHHLARTMFATGQPAAFGTHQHGRIAAAVDEQQALFTTLNTQPDLAQQLFADTVSHHSLVNIDAIHFRQSGIGLCAACQPEQPITPVLGIVITLK